jgi:hypothetical protein
MVALPFGEFILWMVPGDTIAKSIAIPSSSATISTKQIVLDEYQSKWTI